MLVFNNPNKLGQNSDHPKLVQDAYQSTGHPAQSVAQAQPGVKQMQYTNPYMQPGGYYQTNIPYTQVNQPNQPHPKILKKMEINKIIPKSSGSLWTGLEFRPRNIVFANQNPDETVYIVVRPHWSVNLNWMIKNLFYSLLPIITGAALAVANIKIDFLTIKSLVLILLFFYSIILTNIFKDFFDWFFDPYIVTDQRILHYEFNPFSSYKIKETDLSNIEYVKEQSTGLMANIFGYGDLIITTSSERAIFEFKKVPNATQIRDIISDLKLIAKRYS